MVQDYHQVWYEKTSNSWIITKCIRGTDFAAPKGTPIMASGDLELLKAGWCGGGGNCIKIRHNSTY